MIYSTRRFVLSLALCYFVLVFSVLLSLRLPHLENKELILVLFVYVCSICACLVWFGLFGLDRLAVKVL